MSLTPPFRIYLYNTNISNFPEHLNPKSYVIKEDQTLLNKKIEHTYLSGDTETKETFYADVFNINFNNINIFIQNENTNLGVIYLPRSSNLDYSIVISNAVDKKSDENRLLSVDVLPESDMNILLDVDNPKNSYYLNKGQSVKFKTAKGSKTWTIV